MSQTSLKPITLRLCTQQNKRIFMLKINKTSQITVNINNYN